MVCSEFRRFPVVYMHSIPGGMKRQRASNGYLDRLNVRRPADAKLLCPVEVSGRIG
jgi:hypothetical protein